ncbi:MAG: hypothetical protein WBF38_03885 [Nitrosotalea sp.]
MPDKSCRTCGGELMMHFQCTGCKKAIQKICTTCSALTHEQFHHQCNKQEPILNVQGKHVLEIAQKKTSFKQSTHSVHSVAVTFGVIGFFILGFTTAAYLDVFQNQFSSAEMMKSGNAPVPQARYAATISDSLQDCLAYGSGESVTVTCPTQYGYVYNAILDMPKDLASKFADSIFSIRGVSLIEHSDGSVVLQYQNNNYLTSFFAI